MERSASQELDRAGMQPHAREYIEDVVNYDRSMFKARRMPGVVSAEAQYDNQRHRDGFGEWADYHPDPMPGIHFNGHP